MSTEAIIQIGMPIALAIIMLSMGLGLLADDFKRVVAAPRDVLVAMVAQLVVLPLVGFGLAHAFGLEPVLAVGLVLLTACPGGPTSNLFTSLARGDTAFSVSLTAVSGTLTVFTIPLIVGFALRHFGATGDAVDIDVLATIAQLILVVLVPIGAGMWLRARSNARGDGRADRWETVARRVSVGILIVLVVGAVVKERGRMPVFIERAGLPMVTLNLVTMCLGFAIGRVFGMSRRRSMTLTIEVGIQNAGMAMSIAIGLLQNVEMAIPAAMYGLWMYVSVAVAIHIGRRILPPLPTSPTTS